MFQAMFTPGCVAFRYKFSSNPQIDSKLGNYDIRSQLIEVMVNIIAAQRQTTDLCCKV